MKTYSLVIAISLLWSGAHAQSTANIASPASSPLATIVSLDLPRYMGTWYEIAKYPNRFQKQCVADVSAEYRLQTNGSVQVTNRCRTENSTMDDAVGEAGQVGPATSPKLQVRFAPVWLSWLPMVWGNYWVIDLDAEYQLVAVSEPNREYLWVLARTPTVTTEVYDALLGRLKAQGFDLGRLERTKQGK